MFASTSSRSVSVDESQAQASERDRIPAEIDAAGRYVARQPFNPRRQCGSRPAPMAAKETEPGGDDLQRG